MYEDKTNLQIELYIQPPDQVPHQVHQQHAVQHSWLPPFWVGYKPHLFVYLLLPLDTIEESKQKDIRIKQTGLNTNGSQLVID